MLKNESDLIRLIQQDDWMMGILTAASTLNLPDWWICAGFVRSKVWDTLHSLKQRTALSDIDVIYFEAQNVCEAEEMRLEAQLHDILPDIPWSVKNQGRMHIRNNVEPYTSSIEAMARFPETATAIGVKLNRQNNVVLAAPHEITDLINLNIRPTPYFLEDKKRLEIYRNRIAKKKWKSKWPKLNLVSHEE